MLNEGGKHHIRNAIFPEFSLHVSGNNLRILFPESQQTSVLSQNEVSSLSYRITKMVLKTAIYFSPCYIQDQNQSSIYLYILIKVILRKVPEIIYWLSISIPWLKLTKFFSTNLIQSRCWVHILLIFFFRRNEPLKSSI